jgi:hypothetical protein
MTFDVKSVARLKQSNEPWTTSFNAIHIAILVNYPWREFGQPIQFTSKARIGDINESCQLLLQMPNLRVMEENHGWNL